VQTVVNYKKGGVRFVNQVRTLPVYDEEDELAAFMSMLSEVDGLADDADAVSINPGHAHLWAALQLRFESQAPRLCESAAADGAARVEAARVLLTNHEAVLADSTADEPSPTQPALGRVPPAVRPYVDQALRELCRRLLGVPHGPSGRGVFDERLEGSHPAHAAQQQAWTQAAAFLDRRIQTEPHPSGRRPDMSTAAAAAMRAALREMLREMQSPLESTAVH